MRYKSSLNKVSENLLTNRKMKINRKPGIFSQRKINVKVFYDETYLGQAIETRGIVL
jgi:hypothetical protein